MADRKKYTLRCEITQKHYIDKSVKQIKKDIYAVSPEEAIQEANNVIHNYKYDKSVSAGVHRVVDEQFYENALNTNYFKSSRTLLSVPHTGSWSLHVPQEKIKLTSFWWFLVILGLALVVATVLFTVRLPIFQNDSFWVSAWVLFVALLLLASVILFSDKNSHLFSKLWLPGIKGCVYSLSGLIVLFNYSNSLQHIPRPEYLTVILLALFEGLSNFLEFRKKWREIL